MRRKRYLAGFTLIEMMIVVSILGVLSALAIPSFAVMIARSKTAEVGANLSSMYKHAASYYASERSNQGHVSSVAGHCTVDDAVPSPAVPRKIKQSFSADVSFTALSFTIADAVYYQYGLASISGTSSCNHSAGSAGLYTFYAHGDLDSDGTFSTFELSAGTDDYNLLFHSRGLYVDRETE